MSIPEHYSPVMPYLVVSDAEGFIKFIKEVFNAEEKLRVNTDDGSVMHCEYSINGGTIMFGQAGDQWKAFPCAMYLVVKDVDGLYAKGLAHGASGNQEPDERGYGRAAGFIDPHGNQWWLNDPEGRDE
ncbi:MAG TPA: VOC family protein [Pyrinomonadaceae bacterium]|nr:VOC family protein [Pyrinomonadaceae bacterium]